MRIEKIAILDEVVARVKDSDYCFIIDHGGVTVAQFAKLRKALRALDSRLLVVKNTFLGKVAKEKGWSEEVNAMFKGNSAIVTGHGEPTAVSRQGSAPCDASHAPQGACDPSRPRPLREGQEGWRRRSRAGGSGSVNNKTKISFR